MTKNKTYSNDAPIGVFDSGIGGMTVLGEIVKLLPNEKIIYVGDTLHFPYGEKTADQIREYSLQICDWLEVQGVKMIVIACNTITAAAYDHIVKHVDVPVVGVVESGVKAATEITKNNSVGILATQATVNLGIYNKYLLDYNLNINIVSVAAPKLVNYVEDDLDMVLNHPSQQLFYDVRKYVEPFIEHNCDTLVMACTHFPFLEKYLDEALPEGVALVSPSKHTAEEVSKILNKNDMLNTGDAKYDFYTTDNDVNKLEDFLSNMHQSIDAKFAQLSL